MVESARLRFLCCPRKLIAKHVPAKVKRVAAKASRQVPRKRFVSRGFYVPYFRHRSVRLAGICHESTRTRKDSSTPIGAARKEKKKNEQLSGCSMPPVSAFFTLGKPDLEKATCQIAHAFAICPKVNQEGMDQLAISQLYRTPYLQVVVGATGFRHWTLSCNFTDLSWTWSQIL